MVAFFAAAVKGYWQPVEEAGQGALHPRVCRVAWGTRPQEKGATDGGWPNRETETEKPTTELVNQINKNILG